MNITVNEKLQYFYLALSDRYTEKAGHEIKVGKYRFCAIPVNDAINISEVTTGAKVVDVSVDFTNSSSLQTKEGLIKYLNQIGESISQFVEKQDDFDVMLENMQEDVIGRLGKMPKTKDVEGITWI